MLKLAISCPWCGGEHSKKAKQKVTFHLFEAANDTLTILTKTLLIMTSLLTDFTYK